MPVSTFLLVAASLALAPASQSDRPRGGTQDEPFDPKPFRIRDTQAARWQMEEIEGHVAARRWSDAIDGLQRVLEENRGDVLGPELARLSSGGRASQPTHHGAAPRARARLFQLPEEARTLYRERHEPEAAAALARAWQLFDRRGLSEVARRYPLTRAAQRAAWTLGDYEWEQGQGDEALAAWTQAMELVLEKPELTLAAERDWTAAGERVQSQSGRSPEELRAIAARVQAAVGWLAKSDDAGRASSGSRRGARPPGRDSDAWIEPFALPNNPYSNAPRQILYGAKSDASLFVSTSLRVFSLDAYSGALNWKSDEPPGWSQILPLRTRDEWFRGVDRLDGRIQPAANERVVVAALQIPLSFTKNETFQNNIPITTVIPDRRLFAFDAQTGAPLWNQLPPKGWDGDSGGFLERMSVAGPPVIVGSRVIAPCYRMQGRIDYHVGCFDLETGALLWSTDVISGQRELNMFGRPEHEFCAPPLVVHGDQVIAQTQLGAIASLDLYSGEVRWVTLYDQIPLARSQNLAAAQRETPWRNQPPVIAGKTIVAAPYDSRNLVGIDLDSGSLVWSVSNMHGTGTIERLAGNSGERIDQLVGARDDTVYLAGRRVVALRSAAGLATAPPLVLKWTWTHPAIDGDGPAAACVLTDDRLVVPTDELCLSIDLVSGRGVDEGLAWQPGAEDGNVLVGERQLFSVGNRKVAGYFDWGVLVQRARRLASERPKDAQAALALGRLLANRGAQELERRGQSQEARDALAEARAVLERALEAAGDSERAEVAAELHRTLRVHARALAALADRAGALAALKRARPLAPTAEELRDTLLEELALVRRAHDAPGAERGAPEVDLAAREELYAELDARCGALGILCSPEGADAASTGGDGRTTSELDASAPFAFEPVVGARARGDLLPIEIPVTLWTAFARETVAIRRGDTAREFALLHGVLDEHPDVQLYESTAGERATARIGQLLRGDRKEGYEPFAARAEQELEAAIRDKDKPRMLALSRRYPFSDAAKRANDVRLGWALESGEISEVARIVQSELSYRWSAATATPREIELCLGLAKAARASGNVELASELVRSLADAQPELVVRVQEGEKSLRDLASGIERAPIARFRAVSEPGTFALGAKSVPQDALPGELELLGRSQLASGERDLLVGFTTPASPSSPGPGGKHAETLYSLRESDAKPRWFKNLPAAGGPTDASMPWAHHVASSRGRVLLACADSLVALDATTGEPAWSWGVPGPAPSYTSVVVQSGVAVLSAIFDEGTKLYALDAWSGAPLWQDGPQSNEYQSEVVCSSDRAVSLPFTAKAGVVVRDLFTGRRVAQFDLPLKATSAILDQAWIEGERLIVPRFNETAIAELNQIYALDLDTGARAWKVDVSRVASERRHLTDVLQAHGRTYLVLRTSPGTNVQSFQAGLYELSTSIGAVAPIQNVRLSAFDRVLGAHAQGERTELGSSLVLVLSPSPNNEEARVRAIDLERGELWSQGLGAKTSELHPPYLPAPAWSSDAVVMCYGVYAQARSGAQTPRNTYLAVFERGTGVLRETRLLEPRYVDKADAVGLYPLGDVLIVRGKNRMEFLR